MSTTQAEFERELQGRLDSVGFDLNKRDVQEILEIIGNLVQESLREGMKGKDGTPAVTVRGVGKFSVRSYPARKGRNPATGEAIRIKASKRMKVLAPKPMRDSLKVR
jgi:DNA-binding protein HU-beta